MKRSAYKKAWSLIVIAAVMVVMGIMYEPLIAVLGMTVIMTSVMSSTMERKNRKYEELLGERVAEGTYEVEREVGFTAHKVV